MSSGLPLPSREALLSAAGAGEGALQGGETQAAVRVTLGAGGRVVVAIRAGPGCTGHPGA